MATFCGIGASTSSVTLFPFHATTFQKNNKKKVNWLICQDERRLEEGDVYGIENESIMRDQLAFN